MKALSIRQPWAWLILHGGKDIENRVWRTRYRGPLLIHAAKGMTEAEYLGTCLFAAARGVELPAARDLLRGGIVGQVEVVNCVAQSESRWFEGPFGLVLADPVPLPFRELRGMLGMFEVPA